MVTAPEVPVEEEQGTGEDPGERWQYERKHPSRSANGMP